MERLDDCHATVVLEMRTGNHLGAVDRLLRIQERRAKLTDLDAPDRLAVREQGIYKHQHELKVWQSRSLDEMSTVELMRIALGNDPETDEPLGDGQLARLPVRSDQE